MSYENFSRLRFRHDYPSQLAKPLKQSGCVEMAEERKIRAENLFAEAISFGKRV
jgi:hypothetical protein